MTHPHRDADMTDRLNVRRAVRIFPLYYVFLTLSCRGLSGPIPERVPKTRCGIGFFDATNILIDRGYGPNTVHGGSKRATLWLLAVEEQFYLFWPFLMGAIARHRVPALCVTIIVLAVTARAAFTLNGNIPWVRTSFSVSLARRARGRRVHRVAHAAGRWGHDVPAMARLGPLSRELWDGRSRK